MTRLIAKLAAVMAAVDRVPKRGRNTFHGYDFATEADIAEALRGELAQRIVMMIPRVVSWEFKDLGVNKKGDPKEPLVIMHMTFTFIDGETDERLEIPWVGAGQDGGDKGFYKAMTGAEKYVLLKTFLLPTGDDPENDGEKAKGVTVEAPGSAPVSIAVAPSSRASGPSAGELGPLTIKKVESPWEGAKGMQKGFVVLSDGRELPIYNEKLKTLAEQLCQDGVAVDVIEKISASGKAYLSSVCRAELTEPAGEMLTADDIF